MDYFKINNEGSKTTVEETTKEEYEKTCAVIAMIKALEVRKDEFSYPEGNIINKIMEQLIRESIPVYCIEKIVISTKLFHEVMRFGGVEVSFENGKFYIFDGIVPIESDVIHDYQIIMKEKE